MRFLKEACGGELGSRQQKVLDDPYLFLMYLLLQREIKTPNAGPIYLSGTGGRGSKVILVDCKNVFFYSQQEKPLNFQVEGNTVNMHI